ncbi:MAG: S4 domain-containing protein YaaA [Erysipelotrichaceae bacterium]|jgi:S4 domain protein YaaA|nr:S4 domain-containing protein YaaA [Erysipelotrichaceae bacterium]
MAQIQKIKIRDEYVTLGQFLKLADLISSGGEARFFLKENPVEINGEGDQRRGRKLYEKDVIRINGEVYEICR